MCVCVSVSVCVHKSSLTPTLDGYPSMRERNSPTIGGRRDEGQISGDIKSPTSV